MGAATIPLILGGASSYLGNQQNEMANRRADHASNEQDRLIKMQEDLFNTIKGIVSNADASGQFDPTARIANFKRDMNQQAQHDQNALATSMRISGYRPGDSEIAARSTAMQKNSADNIAKGIEGIKQDAFAQKLQAYGAINGGSLNPGIGAYGDRAAQALTQRTNVGANIAPFMPYLVPQQQRPFALPSWALKTFSKFSTFGIR